jgi:hypothetical protein
MLAAHRGFTSPTAAAKWRRRQLERVVLPDPQADQLAELAAGTGERSPFIERLRGPLIIIDAP